MASSRLVLSTVARNASADAAASLLNGGVLRLFTAAQRGALLAELAFASQAFGPAVEGAAMARPMTPARFATATGRAAWFSATTANGQIVLSGQVGGPGSGAPVIITDPEIRLGDEVVVDEFVYTQPEGDSA